MKHIIKETERGFLFKNGLFVKMLAPGKHTLRHSNDLRLAPLGRRLDLTFTEAELTVFAKDPAFREQTVSVSVPDGQIAVHRVDGRFCEALGAGHYTCWNIVNKHEFELYDITAPDVPEALDPMLCTALEKSGFMHSFNVDENKQGLLFFNGRFERMLEAGKYFFWRNAIMVSLRTVETRRQELSLTGQEILTKDKVGVRLNVVCSYRVTDCLRAFQEVDDCEVQFRTALQLAVREHLSGLTLDELLAQRETLGEQLTEKLRPKAAQLCIEVFDTGLRDIILPGEVRDIMSTVLIAEKRAQANVITRREEVASTRSLLNTAKLMDENKTLYKLKELEYLEKICENVGSISVSGGDLLENLREIIQPRS